MLARFQMLKRCLLLVLLPACVRLSAPAPAEAPPEPPLLLPPGCEASLDGTWQHADDPAFRYEAADDGGTLTLLVRHEVTVDAGFVPRRFRAPPDAGQEEPPVEPPAPAARVELHRTPQGFTGYTLATLTLPGGATCDARFATRVLQCDDALLLETLSATTVTTDCEPSEATAPIQHRLVKAP